MKVIVADGNVMVRQVVTGALIQMGIIAISQASSRQDLIKMVKREDFDLILIGRFVLITDGIETAQIIRLRGRNVPIILIISHPDRTLILKAIDTGINNYISYPVDQEIFEEKVNKVMEGLCEKNCRKKCSIIQ